MHLVMFLPCIKNKKLISTRHRKRIRWGADRLMQNGGRQFLYSRTSGIDGSVAYKNTWKYTKVICLTSLENTAILSGKDRAIGHAPVVATLRNGIALCLISDLMRMWRPCRNYPNLSIDELESKSARCQTRAHAGPARAYW